MNKRLILAILGGFVIGSLWLVGFRFATIKSEAVHYHANFAIFINGQRLELKSFGYYEEVNKCADETKNNPKDRAHMHGQKDGLIHIHAPAVTWGHFFANLGFALGNDVFTTEDRQYLSNENNKLTYLLNGQPVDGIANKLIESKDKLLINYGNQNDQQLAVFAKNIPDTAHAANTENDPASCSGGEKLSFSQRLQKAIGL